MTARTQQVIRILILLVVIALLLGRYVPTPGIERASLQQPPTLSVIPGPELPWLEVYVDGVLTSEWHPRDGEVYWVLERMVERETLLLAQTGEEIDI